MRKTQAKSVSQKTEEFLLKQILYGNWRPGHNLLPERELAEEVGVNRCTLRTVLNALNREGWINTQHGRSTTVNNYLNSISLKAAINHLPDFNSQEKTELIAGALQAEHYLFEILIRKQEKILQSDSPSNHSWIESKSDHTLSHKYISSLEYLCRSQNSLVYTLIINELRPLLEMVLSIFQLEIMNNTNLDDFLNAFEAYLRNDISIEILLQKKEKLTESLGELVSIVNETLSDSTK